MTAWDWVVYVFWVWVSLSLLVGFFAGFLGFFWELTPWGKDG